METQGRWDDFASLIPLLLVFTIATFPGEWLEVNLPSLRVVPTKWPSLRPTNNRSEQTLTKRNGNDDDKSDVKKEAQPLLSRTQEKVVYFVRSMQWDFTHRLLVAGDVDPVARKMTSLWSNALVVPNVSVSEFDSKDNIDAAPDTAFFAGRRA